MFLTLIACNEDHPPQKATCKPPEKRLKPLHFKPYWIWLSSDYYPNLHFTNNDSFVNIEFDGQCHYTFPVTENSSNNFVLLFDTIMDCNHEIGLKNTYNLNRTPEVGKPFIQFNHNEDTIHFKYLFPTWTDSMNAQFPNHPLFQNLYQRVNLSQH